jgi:hypothetical protein
MKAGLAIRSCAQCVPSRRLQCQPGRVSLPSVQRDDLGAALPSFDDRLSDGVDAMNLKPTLGKIETDHGTMHSRRLLSIVAFTDDHLMAHRYRRAGASTPSRFMRKKARVADVGVQSQAGRAKATPV